MGGDGTIMVPGVAIWSPLCTLSQLLDKASIKVSQPWNAQPRFETPPNCFVTKLINWPGKGNKRAAGSFFLFFTLLYTLYPYQPSHTLFFFFFCNNDRCRQTSRLLHFPRW